jgi:pyruvate dehydrogenase E2 component (dihydrolipoamide acetyltransferase)
MKRIVVLTLVLVVALLIVGRLAQAADNGKTENATPAAAPATTGTATAQPKTLTPEEQAQQAKQIEALRNQLKATAPGARRDRPFTTTGMVQVVKDAQGKVTAVKLQTMMGLFDVSLDEKGKELAEKFEGKRVQVTGEPTLKVATFGPAPERPMPPRRPAGGMAPMMTPPAAPATAPAAPAPAAPATPVAPAETPAK